MTGNFFSIHGIDGVGKTTITELLAEQMSRENVNASSWDLFATRAELDTLPSSRGDFAASIAKKAIESEAIRLALEQGETVVKDRWVIDVLAAHAYKGTLAGIDPTMISRLLKPDFSVVLTCQEQQRMARVHSRANPTDEDLIPRVPGTRAYFFQDYLLGKVADFSRDHVVIDTTEKDQVQVVTEILEWTGRDRSL